MTIQEKRKWKRAYMKKWYLRNSEKVKGWSRRYYAANIEKARNYAREYAKAHTSEAQVRIRKWKKGNPEKVTACRRLLYAVQKGRIIRPNSCSSCHKDGKPDAHHHRGYDPEHWYDVIWLCRICHKAAHLQKA